MELTWIDDFIALERVRHFTKAAELRATTQSAYSRRIMRLEEWLGCKLFERETRPVTLTPEGREFFVRAKRLREDIVDTKRAINALASRYTQAKRIYTTNTLAVGFFSGWATQQNLQHYSLTVASLTACQEAVRAGRADQALIPLFDDLDLSAFSTRIVGQDRLQLLATVDVAEKIVVKNRRLHGPLLLYPPTNAFGVIVDRLLTQAGITPEQDAICESSSAEALQALAVTQLGAAWLPGMLRAPELVACAVPKSLSCEYKIALIGS